MPTERLPSVVDVGHNQVECYLLWLTNLGARAGAGAAGGGGGGAGGDNLCLNCCTLTHTQYNHRK